MSVVEKIRLLRYPRHDKVMYAFEKYPEDEVVWISTIYEHENEVNTHAIHTYARRTGIGDMDYDIFCEKVLLLEEWATTVV